jgi:hypothetical protein
MLALPDDYPLRANTVFNQIDMGGTNPDEIDHTELLAELDRMYGTNYMHDMEGPDPYQPQTLGDMLQLYRPAKMAAADITSELQARSELMGSRGRARMYGRPEPADRDYDWVQFTDSPEEQKATIELLRKLADHGFSLKDRPGGYLTASSPAADYSVYPLSKRDDIMRAWELQEGGMSKDDAWAQIDADQLHKAAMMFRNPVSQMLPRGQTPVQQGSTTTPMPGAGLIPTGLDARNAQTGNVGRAATVPGMQGSNAANPIDMHGPLDPRGLALDDSSPLTPDMRFNEVQIDIDVTHPKRQFTWAHSPCWLVSAGMTLRVEWTGCPYATQKLGDGPADDVQQGRQAWQKDAK